MSPDTNKFEKLTERPSLKDIFLQNEPHTLLRPDGSPCPKHWSVFQVGEDVVIKDYTFKVAYIGETAILFEPVGPVMVNDSIE